MLNSHTSLLTRSLSNTACFSLYPFASKLSSRCKRHQRNTKSDFAFQGQWWLRAHLSFQLLIMSKRLHLLPMRFLGSQEGFGLRCTGSPVVFIWSLWLELLGGYGSRHLCALNSCLWVTVGRCCILHCHRSKSSLISGQVRLLKLVHRRQWLSEKLARARYIVID